MVQVGGSYAGAMLGSGGFLLAVQALGWPLALAGAAAAIALFSLPMLAVQEPPRTWAHDPSDAEPNAPESAPTDAPENGVCRWPRPSLLDAGVDMSQLGWLLGAFSLLAGLALAAQAALLAALAALAAAAPAHPAFLPGLTGLMGLFFASAGCLWVALYAVLMQAASPLQPGVDFSLFRSADALVAVAGGWLAQRGGYDLCLAGASLLAAAGAWLLARQDAAAPRAQIQQIH